MREKQGARTLALCLAASALVTMPAARAVTIQDSQWRQDGGREGHEADGFTSALRLAAEPQFRSVLALSRDGESWGEGSATWIGNARGTAYLLTAAHIYTRPAQAGEYVVRAPDGKTIKPDRIWVHPGWNGDVDERTGYDLVILRLPKPITDAGEPAPIYTGAAERGQLITFVGYGSRGVGSTGEQDRFYAGTDKAAAQGIVDQVERSVLPLPKSGDAGNYLGVWLGRENGSLTNPYGGSNKPATPLTGLLGSGDSGGSAWMRVGGVWVVVGVNSNGSGTAAYGDSSWFTRVSTHRDWIRGIVPDARFNP